MRPLTPLRDTGLLIARVLLGVILIAHGWQKLVTNGLDGTAGAFEQMGVPLPMASATVAALVELGGGLLLLLGALTPLVGLAIIAVMGGAFAFVHAGSGLFVADGGWELVATIALAALTFAVVGPGRFSLDHVLARRRRTTATAGPQADAKTNAQATTQETAAGGAAHPAPTHENTRA